MRIALVRVRTDSGIEGVGECFVPDAQGRAVFAARQVVEGSLARVVLGEDVRHTEVLWERMYAVCGGPPAWTRRCARPA